ncbi:MAG: chloride channel protein [Alphaproteobacteria bacterium]
MYIDTVTRTRVWLRRLSHNEHLILNLLALVAGIAAAYGAVAFRLGVDLIQVGTLGFALDYVSLSMARLPWWHIVLVPTAGGLIVGAMLHWLHDAPRARSISDIIEASALRGGRLPLRHNLVSSAIHMVSLGFGSSIGREGPAVHLGATLSAFFAARLRLGRSQSRTMLGCGVAAATASLFNAPVAGVVFAIEVVVGNLSLKAAVPIVLASVTGTAIGRFHFGSAPAFTVPSLELISLWEFPAFAGLGLVSALVAMAFMQAIFTAGQLAERTHLPLWLQPAVGGLVVGVLAIWWPQIIGVGYLTTDAALRGEFGLELLLALIAAKIVATSFCVGFGFGGGVFSPALYLGALVGGAYGLVAGSFFPDMFSGVPAYALIGTGALAGAVLGAPLSTIFIIFELTGSSSMMIAVMIATGIASLVTSQVYARSFFAEQLRGRGIVLTGGHEQALLRSIRVDDVMKRQFGTISSDADVAAMNAALQATPYGELYVVDEDRRVLAILGYAELGRAIVDSEGQETLVAGVIARPIGPVLTADDDLERAMMMINAEGEHVVPVVADKEGMRLVGLIRELDVAEAYNRALLRARDDEHA